MDKIKKSQQSLTWKTRIGWGFGGIADNFIVSTLLVLSLPIYNIAFGMDPFWLGIAIFIPRMLDAITDPLMGNISDNTRTRWGRRRPYIISGAIVSAVILPLLWMPPFKTDFAMFWYFCILASIYYTAYTVYVVPYTALGYELTTDYDERTRVIAWRMYLGLGASMAMPWLYKLCLLPIFGSDVALGACWVSLGVGVVIITTGLMPVLTCREKELTQHQPRISLIKAFAYTIRNWPFIILLTACLIFICGIFTVMNFGLYINIYHVCDGDKSFAATLTGLAGTVGALTAYIALPLITWVSVRTSKRFAIVLSLICASVGSSSYWFTMTPTMPYLQIISAFVVGLGMGSWLMSNSMTADICDEDELKSGLRREGFYGAVYGFSCKLAMAGAALLGGILLKLSGYDAKVAEELVTVDSAVIFKMRVFFVGIQVTTYLLSAVLFLCYPITRARSEETRRILDERKNSIRDLDNIESA